MRGKACNYELRFKKEDDTLLTISVNSSPIYVAEKIVGVVSFGRNITHDKLIQEQLTLLNKAISQSPVTVVITDKNGDIRYANPKFTELTGYTIDEALGKNPRILQSGFHNKGFYNELWETISSGKNWQGEFLNKKKNGDTFWESAVISPVTNSNGELSYYIAVKEDITEKKKMIEDLIAAKVQAEESDRLKSAFLANMSHEIRTPMNGILGFAELLKMPDLTGDQQQEYIGIIKKSGDRMLNIINDIIDISKIESKQMKVSLSETKINEQTEFVHTFFIPEAENKGIKLICKNGLPAYESVIITDREKLYAILVNLVKNAIKYTDSGIIEFGYTLRTDNRLAKGSEMGYLEFYVKDTGIGVPVNRQDAIFDRFVQADIADSRAFQGAGLGLSISKAYVEMLGGRIWVESEVGKGSAFYFTIPYQVEKEVSPIISEIFKADEVLSQIRNLKILIAEDDETSELLITLAIRSFCDKVFTARNGKDAVEICRNNSEIDMILMDIKMPEMDGYDATRLIRQFNNEVVIIAQTAFGLTGDKEKALEAGCNDYISKPIDVVLLKSLINKYFNQQ